MQRPGPSQCPDADLRPLSAILRSVILGFYRAQPKFGSCPPTLAGFFNADESLRLFGTLTPWVKPTI